MNRLYLLFISFLFIACRPGSGQRHFEPSAQLTAALEQAGHLLDSGADVAADSLVNSVFLQLKPNTADSLHWLAFTYNIYLHHRRYRDALKVTDSLTHRLQKNLDDPDLRRMYTDALFAKGDALYALGVYPAGLRAFYLAQQVGLRYEDKCVMADFSYRLANISFRQERYLEAAASYHKALQRIDDCQRAGFPTAAYHQVLLNNIGLCLTRTGLPDSALQFFAMAHRMADKYAAQYPMRANYWRMARRVIQGNEAEALTLKKDYPEAAGLLREALSDTLYLALEPQDALLSGVKMAEVFVRTGRFREAALLLDTLQQSPLFALQPRAAFKTEVLKGRILEHEGDYPGATLALQRAMNYRDKFLEERRKYTLLNLDENIRLMNEADRNQVLQAKVQRNNLIIIIILLVMLLLILAGLFVYMNLRRSNKYVHLLRLLNERVKSQNEQLAHTLEELQQSNREKDRIMQMVAHDLRSPVASIYWLANVMLEDENLNEEQRNNLDLILLASNNSLSLTKDMLEAISLLHTNELSRSTCDVRRMVERQAQLQQNRLAEKHLSLKLSLPDEPVEAEVDAEKFSQVISNLLTNAIKFSHENNEVALTLQATAYQLTITVRDHGIGLPEGKEQQIFEAFSDSRRDGTHGEKSYGLGLSISRRIVELHGGVIRAQNLPDGGALFTIQLPLSPPIDVR